MAPGTTYDLAIIGSGSAAFAAAITAREQDARVVMVERGTIGGTCVNIGCVPSKTLLKAAETYHAASYHPFAGIETDAGGVELGKTTAQKDQLVGHLRQEKYANLIDQYGWEMITGQGDARFLDEGTLEVGSRTIRAKHYLIATGSRPAIPTIPGLADSSYLTSTTALELTALPRSLVVIGAGYIALELGQLFRRLGAEVTLLQRGKRLLPEAEPEISDALEAMLAHEGIDVLTGTQVERVDRTGTGRQVHVRVDGQQRVLRGEQVLVATGRMPNVEALHLSTAGIETDARGAIVVNAQLRTSNPRVFAAGDVTLVPQYVYVAAYQGGLAAENALHANRAGDLRAVPGVIFTEPQIATVGLTEAQARDAGIEVKTSVLPINAVPRAQVTYEEVGVFKLVADATTNQVLGAHVATFNSGRARIRVRLLVRSAAPFIPPPI